MVVEQVASQVETLLPTDGLKSFVLCEKYRAKGNCVFTFGMKTAFGGGKSTGFGLVYDSEAKAMAMEARYRLVRVRRAQRPAASTGSRATGLQARAAHTTLMWLTARCACHRTV